MQHHFPLIILFVSSLVIYKKYSLAIFCFNILQISTQLLFFFYFLFILFYFFIVCNFVWLSIHHIAKAGLDLLYPVMGIEHSPCHTQIIEKIPTKLVYSGHAYIS